MQIDVTGVPDWIWWAVSVWFLASALSNALDARLIYLRLQKKVVDQGEDGERKCPPHGPWMVEASTGTPQCQSCGNWFETKEPTPDEPEDTTAELLTVVLQAGFDPMGGVKLEDWLRERLLQEEE